MTLCKPKKAVVGTRLKFCVSNSTTVTAGGIPQCPLCTAEVACLGPILDRVRIDVPGYVLSDPQGLVIGYNWRCENRHHFQVYE